MTIAALLLGSMAPLLISAASGTAAQTFSPTGVLPSITGSYTSQITNAGVITPGLTEFLLVDNHTLVGSYFFEEDGTKILGVLTQCQTVRPRTIQCTWRDRYGSGNFEAEFSKDFSGFDGSWNALDSSEKHEWRGVRQ